MTDPGVQRAAASALELIADGMRVGLGTRHGAAAMLHRALDGPVEPDVLPAQIVAPHHGRLRWLVDADAAAQLEGR